MINKRFIEKWSSIDLEEYKYEYVKKLVEKDIKTKRSISEFTFRAILKWKTNRARGYIEKLIVANLLLFYLIFSLIWPCLWASKNDKPIVKIKQKYHIQFNFRGKKLIYEDEKIPTVGIYMVSNRLCFKWNKTGRKIINNISEMRWLPKRGRSQILFFTPFKYLLEYATILNFKDQFINLVLGLRDWDLDFHCIGYRGNFAGVYRAKISQEKTSINSLPRFDFCVLCACYNLFSDFKNFCGK